MTGVRRIFIDPQAISDGRIRFRPDQSHYLRRVLRLRAGEMVTGILEGEAQLELRIADPQVGWAEIVRWLPPPPEPPVRVHLYQGMVKGQKMTEIVRHCTELGAFAFHPLRTARCVVRLDPQSAVHRIQKWRKVAESASQQCGRGRIPAVHPPVSYAEGLEEACHCETVILAYEGDADLPIREVLKSPRRGSVALIVGPEGGFDAREVEMARSRGVSVVSLGKRILRAETVGPVLTALVMYAWGDLS